jgi:hypothetical protein
LDVVAAIKETRLEWTKYLVRINRERVDKKIFESKPEGRRRIGRPHLRWLKDVEKDLRKMKFKQWRQMVVDKQEWAILIKEVKALRGP